MPNVIYKKRKSLKTALSGYYACVSHDLLLMALGADTQTDRHIHIHTHTDMQTKSFQEIKQRLCASGLKIISMHCYTFLSDESQFM